MFTWWDKREQYLPCTLKQLANSCAPAQKLPYLIPCQPQNSLYQADWAESSQLWCCPFSNLAHNIKALFSCIMCGTPYYDNFFSVTEEVVSRWFSRWLLLFLHSLTLTFPRQTGTDCIRELTGYVFSHWALPHIKKSSGLHWICKTVIMLLFEMWLVRRNFANILGPLLTLLKSDFKY